MRPRFSNNELQLIEYCLGIVQQLAKQKREESDSLPSSLRYFAKYIWYSGDWEALKLMKPYKQYVLTTIHREYYPLELNCRLLRERVEGLLSGRRFHSLELEPLELK